MFKPDNISTPIPFQPDVADDVALYEGDDAADRVIGGGVLIDHLKVGRALMVGSRIAAEEAGTDRGKPYNMAFSRWLQQHPKLAAVNEQNRAAALWCLNPANWPRVEKYLATLDVDERQGITLRTVRRRLDHPPPQSPASRPPVAHAGDTTAPGSQMDGPLRFTKAQEAHVEARIRALDKKREAGFNERVRLAMLERNADYRAGLERLQKEAAEKAARYDRLLNNYKPLFTDEEYRTILICQHPDNSATTARRNTAFKAVQAMKFQLTGKR